tara:strand:+ start:11 stop:1165 length:1155 start_codon:yes stop_codon:yes gene_type:complete
MTSAIVRTNPTSGTATTSSVRDNFGAAADEINVLQRSSTELKPTTGGPIAYNVNFGSSPTFSLVDGARISVRINVTNTSSPLITVSPGISPVSIVKSDGSALAAGELVADSIYDLMYNATLSKWVALNVDAITSQDTLLTTILGGLYPVGGLLTTTNSANPGDADYFFSGITFGTWEAYAQGRTIVGIDTGFGTGFVSGSKTLTQVTIVIAEKALSKGDSITVSGFTGTSDVVNGSQTVNSVVTAAGQTTVIYTVVDATDLASLVGTDVKVINEDFDTSQEIGGEATHTQTESEVANHRHHLVNNRTVPESGNTGIDNYIATQGNQSGSSTNQSYTLRPVTDEANRGLSSFNTVDSSGNTVAQTAMNNLQPYITTYIWKRVVTP